MNGYTGKILHINLSTKEISIEEPDPVFYRRYLGGSGFVGYYLLKETPKGTDPLGPENILVFAGGTFTGVPIAGAGRSVVGAKSPLTGGYGEAEAGGFFGAELRKAGFDAAIIKGKASEPVYLWVHDGEVEIRSAEKIWGTTTKDCQTIIREELGDENIRISMIGPGGEKMVRFACIINDVKHAAGRTGLGAVMGSKNLKAIAVRGKGTISLVDKEIVRKNAKWMAENWRNFIFPLHEHGSAGNLPLLQHIGALPTHNHSKNRFEGASEISGQKMTETILVGREGCYACPVHCKRKVSIIDGDYPVDSAYGGPEYETIGSFGSNCDVANLKAISKAHELCNAYSLDTISTGGMISLAMECYEKGIITCEDTGGLDLSFGNERTMVELTRQICERDGFGDLLAEGPAAFIEKFGEQTRDFSVDVKNSALPMHESRVRHAHAFGYALSPTGADHMHNFWDHSMASSPVSEDMQGMGVYESASGTMLNHQKIRAYAYGSTWSWIHNIICNCMYIPWPKEKLIELINTITGWKTTYWELMKTCERTVTLARVFNMREGLGRNDDCLPTRYYESIDIYPGVDRLAFEDSLSAYYGIMGWDENTGLPTRGKLIELDIEWAFCALSENLKQNQSIKIVN